MIKRLLKSIFISCFLLSFLCGLNSYAQNKNLPNIVEELPYKKIKGLVIMADFPERKYSQKDIAYQKSIYNEMSLSKDGKLQSLNKFLSLISGGKISIDVDIVKITLHLSSEHYYKNSGGTQKANGKKISFGRHNIVKDCIEKLKKDGYDFSKLTKKTDSRRITEPAFICININSKSSSGKPLYPPSKGSLTYGRIPPIKVNGGFSINSFISGPVLKTLIHESCHLILKWPDLYGTQNVLKGTLGVDNVLGGSLCDVPAPSFMYRSGFLNAENLFGKSGKFKMDAKDFRKAYFYYDKNNKDEFFIIQPLMKNWPFRNEFPEEGLCIYRINTKGRNTHYPDMPLMVEMIHSGGLNSSYKKGFLLYNQSQNNSFGPQTYPSSRWKFGDKAGMDSGFKISNIRLNNNEINFELNKYQKLKDKMVFSQSLKPDKSGWIASQKNPAPLKQFSGYTEINREAKIRIPSFKANSRGIELLKGLNATHCLSGNKNPEFPTIVFSSPFSKKRERLGHSDNSEIQIGWDIKRTVKYLEITTASLVRMNSSTPAKILLWTSDDADNWKKLTVKISKKGQNRFLLTLPDNISTRYLQLSHAGKASFNPASILIYGK